MKWENFLVPDEVDLCRLAIVLAMTPTQESEREVIAEYQKLGVRGAATTISGFGISGQTSIIRSVGNLCVNTGLIERKRSQVHPICHCVLEVTQSTRASDAIGQNFLFKAAAVRRREEFALCFYGNLAMHELSGHKTIGVGYQILGQ